jgi:hypothetical protein
LGENKRMFRIKLINIMFGFISAFLLASFIVFAAMPVRAAEIPDELQHLAKQLKVLHLIDRIRELQHEGTTSGYTTDRAIELISLRQKLDFRLTVTSLEIEDVLSHIDYEDTRADELRYLLQNKRDKALKFNSYANLASNGGLTIIAGSLGIANNTLGNIMSTTAGGVSASLGGLAVKEQTDEGVTLRHQGSHPNMLAMIFDFQPDESSKYPDSVWTYLNEPDDMKPKMSRKEALVSLWTYFGRIPSLKSAEGKRECALIAGEVAEQHRLTISLLDDRGAMLSDLRAVVSRMNKKLLQLMLLTQPEQ